MDFRGPELESTIRRAARQISLAFVAAGTWAATGATAASDSVGDWAPLRSASCGRGDGRPLRRPLAQQPLAAQRLPQPPRHQHGDDPHEQREHGALDAAERSWARAWRPSLAGYRDAPWSTRELPTGTVTFFFTDIEGSTRLLHELGADYQRRARAAPPRAARGHSAAPAGARCRRTATRSSPSSPTRDRAVGGGDRGPAHSRRRSGRGGAICACASASTPATATLGVDDYVGHRRPRGRTRLLRGARRPGAAHARGARRARHRRRRSWSSATTVLKDLEQPIELFQLAVDGLQQQFPPLKTLDERRTCRSRRRRSSAATREVHDVRELLLRSETRLVTLTGPGGTARRAWRSRSAASSSRSSRTASRSSRSAASTTRRSSCRRSARRSVSRRRAGARSTRRSRDHLGERRLLLVLDNFEHVLGAAPSRGCSRRAPGVTVLVTSRERAAPLGRARAARAAARARPTRSRSSRARAKAALPTVRGQRARPRGDRARSAAGSTACRSRSSSPPRA